MKTLVVAPHPDDEVLGLGGTLLRRKSEGASIAWLIVTGITEENGWTKEKIALREQEISRISSFFDFDKVYNLGFPTTKLDTFPIGDIINKISKIINSYMPEEIFIPHIGDVHTDHDIVFKAVVSSAKSFRFPFIKKILSYETPSETDFGLYVPNSFNPNVFFDITKFLDKKLEAMEIYSSEMGIFPFPRSKESVQALAKVRGSASGFNAAEAFQLLRSRE